MYRSNGDVRPHPDNLCSMTDSAITLRLGRLDDLAVLRAINDDASALYARVGIVFDIPEHHPVARVEAESWRHAVRTGHAWIAVAGADEPIGFVICTHVDQEPYLAQLAVRCAHMRRGAGTQLVAEAIRWSAGQPLWLTTYGHVAWNRPYYERLGFEVMSELVCGPAMREILRTQRETLPMPEQRIAMKYTRRR